MKHYSNEEVLSKFKEIFKDTFVYVYKNSLDLIEIEINDTFLNFKKVIEICKFFDTENVSINANELYNTESYEGVNLRLEIKPTPEESNERLYNKII